MELLFKHLEAGSLNYIMKEKVPVMDNTAQEKSSLSLNLCVLHKDFKPMAFGANSKKSSGLMEERSGKI